MRAKYEKVQAGMMAEQADAILGHETRGWIDSGEEEGYENTWYCVNCWEYHPNGEDFRIEVVYWSGGEGVRKKAIYPHRPLVGAVGAALGRSIEPLATNSPALQRIRPR